MHVISPKPHMSTLIAHHRVTGDVDLHVSVLVFDFDSDDLLGLKPAPGEVTSFTSRTLTTRTEDEMNQFNSVRSYSLAICHPKVLLLYWCSIVL
jgi:hypothetical protein